MRNRLIRLATASLFALMFSGTATLRPACAQSAPGVSHEQAEGTLRLRSTFGFVETVSRIKSAIAANGVRFFTEIDQNALARQAGIPLHPSSLLLFGNPPLGLQLLTSNPLTGLDWPVRMLVTQDSRGTVWIAWTDFGFIAHRYGINNRAAALVKAKTVSLAIARSGAGAVR